MRECLVCNNTDFIPLYDNTLLKCQRCGFVTANLEISDEELKKIYNLNYFRGEEYLNYLEDKEIIQKNFTRRLKVIFSKVPKEKIRNSLEIGCAYGFFGEVLIRAVPTAYKGVDVSEEGVDYARGLGLNASTGDYLAY